MTGAVANVKDNTTASAVVVKRRVAMIAAFSVRTHLNYRGVINKQCVKFLYVMGTKASQRLAFNSSGMRHWSGMFARFAQQH